MRGGRGDRLVGQLGHADLHVVHCAVQLVQEIFEFIEFSRELLDVLLVSKGYFLGVSMLNHQFSQIVRILVRLFR